MVTRKENRCPTRSQFVLLFYYFYYYYFYLLLLFIVHLLSRGMCTYPISEPPNSHWLYHPIIGALPRPGWGFGIICWLSVGEQWVYLFLRQRSSQSIDLREACCWWNVRVRRTCFHLCSCNRYVEHCEGFWASNTLHYYGVSSVFLPSVVRRSDLSFLYTELSGCYVNHVVGHRHWGYLWVIFAVEDSWQPCFIL